MFVYEGEIPLLREPEKAEQYFPSTNKALSWKSGLPYPPPGLIVQLLCFYGQFSKESTGRILQSEIGHLIIKSGVKALQCAIGRISEQLITS